MTTFVGKTRHPASRHIPYSLDMTSFHFWLFTKLKGNPRIKLREAFMWDVTAQLKTTRSGSDSRNGATDARSVCISNINGRRVQECLLPGRKYMHVYVHML